MCFCWVVFFFVFVLGAWGVSVGIKCDDLWPLHQEKYKRDQEKLQEEWLKAQQEITENVDQQEVRKVFEFEFILA